MSNRPNPNDHMQTWGTGGGLIGLFYSALLISIGNSVWVLFSYIFIFQFVMIFTVGAVYALIWRAIQSRILDHLSKNIDKTYTPAMMQSKRRQIYTIIFGVPMGFAILGAIISTFLGGLSLDAFLIFGFTLGIPTMIVAVASVLVARQHLGALEHWRRNIDPRKSKVKNETLDSSRLVDKQDKQQAYIEQLAAEKAKQQQSEQ